jgi:hypothetical protein
MWVQYITKILPQIYALMILCSWRPSCFIMEKGWRKMTVATAGACVCGGISGVSLGAGDGCGYVIGCSTQNEHPTPYVASNGHARPTE